MKPTSPSTRPLPRPPSRPLPVRDAMLSGRFVGNRDAALADAAHRIPRRTVRRCDRCWFGTERGVRLRIDPRRCATPSIATSPPSTPCCRSSSTPSCTTPACASWKGRWRGVAWLIGGVELVQPAQGQDPQCRLAGDLPRPGTRHRVRPEPDVPQGLRGRVRHARAASRTACWSSITKSAIARRRARTDDVSALAALAGVAAAAFRRSIVGASPGAAGGRRASPISPRRRTSPTPLRNADHARWRSLCRARGHAVRRRRPAATCWRGRPGRTTARAPTVSATANTLRRPKTAFG